MADRSFVRPWSHRLTLPTERCPDVPRRPPSAARPGPLARRGARCAQRRYGTSLGFMHGPRRALARSPRLARHRAQLQRVAAVPHASTASTCTSCACRRAAVAATRHGRCCCRTAGGLGARVHEADPAARAPARFTARRRCRRCPATLSFARRDSRAKGCRDRRDLRHADARASATPYGAGRRLGIVRHRVAGGEPRRCSAST